MWGVDGRTRAAALFQEAYEAQMRGDLREAVRLYERSLEAHPTAEAHTFLGWTWSFLGDLDRGHRLLQARDRGGPDLREPVQRHRRVPDRARRSSTRPSPGWSGPSSRRATRRRSFPRFNLGRVYLAREMLSAALREFEEALDVQPGYEPAIRAIAAVKRKLN